MILYLLNLFRKEELVETDLLLSYNGMLSVAKPNNDIILLSGDYSKLSVLNGGKIPVNTSVPCIMSNLYIPNWDVKLKLDKRSTKSFHYYKLRSGKNTMKDVSLCKESMLDFFSRPPLFIYVKL